MGLTHSLTFIRVCGKRIVDQTIRRNSSMPNIIVLGTGMAWFGAAWRLHAEGITPVMREKNAYPGGHTASCRGFLFDASPTRSVTTPCRSISGGVFCPIRHRTQIRVRVSHTCTMVILENMEVNHFA